MFEPNEHFSEKIEQSLEMKRAKRKFSENSGHDILELYNVLIHVRFATSKKMLISSIIKSVHQLPYELPNNLKLRNLRELRDLRKLGNVIRTSNSGQDIA